ncbi:MAG: ABC transporter ATP-binding protein [Chloroflexaceae bacterium]
MLLHWLNNRRRIRLTNSTPPPSAAAPPVQLRQVDKIYQTPRGAFTALRQIDLTIASGEFVALTGRSGSGKSTLLNMITGIDRPSAGTALVAATPLHALNEDQMALWRGQYVGIIFQFFQLLPTLTILENIMLPMEFSGRHTARLRRERALSLLEAVNLVDQAHKLPAMLSGGQQQRAAVARALANDPPLLVADEPTGNLDSHNARMVVDLLSTLARQGKTVVMVTHDQDLARHATRAIHLDDGRIVGQWRHGCRIPEENGENNAVDTYSVAQNVA